MRLAKLGYCLSLLAVGGILLPSPVQAADALVQTAPRATDVMLDAEGALTGTVVDTQGNAAAGVPISIAAAGVPQVKTVSDKLGNFQIAGLRGGIYQVAAGERFFAVRLWTPQAAPPGAYPSAVLTIDRNTVRGQTPLPDFVRSDAFLITAVVVGAIAIPIAIHNFRNDHPSGS